MLDYSNVAVIYHGMQMYYIIIYRNNKDEITTDTRYVNVFLEITLVKSMHQLETLTF